MKLACRLLLIFFASSYQSLYAANADLEASSECISCSKIKQAIVVNAEEIAKLSKDQFRQTFWQANERFLEALDRTIAKSDFSKEELLQALFYQFENLDEDLEYIRDSLSEPETFDVEVEILENIVKKGLTKSNIRSIVHNDLNGYAIVTYNSF